MRACLFITGAALTCMGCSAETSPAQRPLPSTQMCVAGATQACTCTGNVSGNQSCSPAGTWNACQCVPAQSDGGGHIDNPTDRPPIIDAGGLEPLPPKRDCSPGLYLGTYTCDLIIFGLPFPLTGDVSFNLMINETTVGGECASGEEFCPDLVISENGGTLFGLAGTFGFETMLQGALDCTTGEFRATGLGGRWGNAISSDPSDPDALWTVEEPSFGTFDGELSGTHEASSGETIEGDWNLHETAMDINCIGPFTVTLQP